MKLDIGLTRAVVSCLLAICLGGCASQKEETIVGTWGETLNGDDESGGTSVTVHYMKNGRMTMDIVSIKGAKHLDFTYTADKGKLVQTPVSGTSSGHPIKVTHESLTSAYMVQDGRLVIADPNNRQNMDLKRLADN
jgi:hypothetical protein